MANSSKDEHKIIAQYDQWRVAQIDEVYFVIDQEGNEIHGLMNLPFSLVSGLASALQFMEVSQEDYDTLTDNFNRVTQFVKQVRDEAGLKATDLEYFKSFAESIPSLWPERDGVWNREGNQELPADAELVGIYGEWFLWQFGRKDWRDFVFCDRVKMPMHRPLRYPKYTLKSVGEAMMEVRFEMEDYSRLDDPYGTLTHFIISVGHKQHDEDSEEGKRKDAISEFALVWPKSKRKRKDYPPSGLVATYGDWKVWRNGKWFLLLDKHYRDTHDSMRLSEALVTGFAQILEYMVIQVEDVEALKDPTAEITKIIKRVRRDRNKILGEKEEPTANLYFRWFFWEIENKWSNRRVAKDLPIRLLGRKPEQYQPGYTLFDAAKDAIFAVVGDWKVQRRKGRIELLDKREERTHQIIDTNEAMILGFAEALVACNITFKHYTDRVESRELFTRFILTVHRVLAGKQVEREKYKTLFTSAIMVHWPDLSNHWPNQDQGKISKPPGKEEIELYWTEKAASLLVNRKVQAVRYLEDSELEALSWYESGIVIQLDDGSLLYPSRDDEGNGAGAVFGQGGRPNSAHFTLPTI